MSEVPLYPSNPSGQSHLATVCRLKKLETSRLFYLKLKARIWSRLSYMCRFCFESGPDCLICAAFASNLVLTVLCMHLKPSSILRVEQRPEEVAFKPLRTEPPGHAFELLACVHDLARCTVRYRFLSRTTTVQIFEAVPKRARI